MNESLSQHNSSPEENPAPMNNPEMELAWKLISMTSKSVFLTGKAGTGKTTFLRRLRKETPKRMVVLAPTGVAAINAEGQTIHSFFQLPFGPIIHDAKDARRRSFRMSEQKKKLIRTLDLLVIDEISMVRADLLDAVDTELRKLRDRYKPFGGVQLLLIGDLQQLPPVVKDEEWSLLKDQYTTPYFFGSRALNDVGFETIELKKIYRQQDAEFIDILAKIRDNRLDSAAITALNRRYIPNMAPNSAEGWIRLTTHNRTADDYNARMLNSLPSAPHNFTAKVDGTFPESSYPADFSLTLKVGAQVMFIKNDNEGHKFYNGKIGVVTDIEEKQIKVMTREDGSTVSVPVMEWENMKFALNPETDEIEEQVEGTFRQYPLRLAWAITVHKSQGLTFDNAVLDINESFAHGQVYVALSRCRTLEGLILSRPIDSRAVITDLTVNRFVNNSSNIDELAGRLPELMTDYYKQILDELFDFSRLKTGLAYLERVAAEHLYRKYPNLSREIAAAEKKFATEVTAVASRFVDQYHARLEQLKAGYSVYRLSPDADDWLAERLKSALPYFNDRLVEVIKPIFDRAKLKIENKRIASQYKNAIEAVRTEYNIKRRIFCNLIVDGFSVKNYLNAKAKC